MQLAFCLETLYTDQPFRQRLKSARADGIENIEIWDWRDKSAGLQAALTTEGLSLTNLSANRQFSMIDPNDQTAFLHELRQSALIAKTLRCPYIMLLAQPLGEGGRARTPKSVAASRWRNQLLDTAERAVQAAAELDLQLLLEPLNDRDDHPDYILNSSQLSFQIIREINHPRLRVLYDIYHMSVMGEDIFKDIRENLDAIGYFHLADIPGRAEPGVGHIAYERIIQLLRSENYSGMLGFEFYPSLPAHGEIVRRTIERFQTWLCS
jgi:hydroxypyruvate isomerase